MKIYTKTGDSGQTSLFGGGRVPKTALRIEAYGTVDELNSTLGLARSLGISTESDGILDEVQNDLFVLGSDLATPPDSKASVGRIDLSHIEKLEKWIDELDEKLEPLRYFILPGGKPAAAAIQVARTVCRRAERRTLSAAEENEISNHCIVYLNRLSDFLFVLGRYENKLAGVNETKWKAR